MPQSLAHAAIYSTPKHPAHLFSRPNCRRFRAEAEAEAEAAIAWAAAGV